MSVSAKIEGADERLLSDEESELITSLSETVNGVLRGKEAVVFNVFTSVLAGGHVLLEDVPGVGKTTLAQAISKVLGCSFRRIQFTSDLLPSDVVGVNVYVESTGDFHFRQGPLFANFVLADEINRTTPKTQSSLLEAMSEGQVSLDNETMALPSPFLVVATQNPQDFHGTYPLPESQLDRFMMRLSIGYPAPQQERTILRTRKDQNPVEHLKAIIDLKTLSDLQARIHRVRIDESVLDYILSIVDATRNHASISLGVSTRAALEFQKAIRARALLSGRGYARPDDVKALAAPVLAHRLKLVGRRSLHQQVDGQAEGIILEILDALPVPV